MVRTNIAAGSKYRLKQDLEIRDEKTGTLRAVLRKGTVVAVKRIEVDEDHAFLEGVGVPLRLDALSRMIVPA
ncbi:MAG: hypothetical protein K0R39_2429 [Symbiobacteriaceae bacterium]|jgi:hypothetical protein|nr:hypothetical protein [Symbiobacteriaceae bacterium]